MRALLTCGDANQLLARIVDTFAKLGAVIE